MNLGQDWTTQSIQHCCLRFLAISVGNSTFSVSRAASVPPAVSLQKRHLAFSHHHHCPQFESVSSCGLPESPALLLWRRQGDGENICIKGQASSRVSSGGKAFQQSPYLVPAPRRPHRCPAAPVSWALSSVPPPQGSLLLKWL